MPTRSFEHWYRGESLEAASRTSTSTPWGSRGSLTAPVIRVRSDHTVTAIASLTVTGSGPCAVDSIIAASALTATGGSTRSNVESERIGVAGIEIIASAESTVAYGELVTGGWQSGGFGPSHTSAHLVGETGGQLGGLVSSWFSQSPTSAGGWSSGGSSSDAQGYVEVAAGGVACGQASPITLRHALAGAGGTSIGGIGSHRSASAGKSFKYWFRGGVIGADDRTRRGDFARGFRGWLGFPTAGVSGAGRIVELVTGGAIVGGSSVGSLHVDGRTISRAAMEFGSSWTLANQHHPVISGGTAESGGSWNPSRGTSMEAVAAVVSSGTADLRWTSGESLIAACSIGGFLEPRVNVTSTVTARLEASSTVAPRSFFDLRAGSNVGFGASAHVDVNHATTTSVFLGATAGGAFNCVVSNVLTASGGFNLGGSQLLAPISLVYHVYGNDGQGGPIDYSEPIAMVSGLEWTSSELSPGMSMRFGVRAYDARSGIQEENLDASITLVIDDRGLDATRMPLPPVGLRAIDLGEGRIRIEWAASGDQASRRATSFHVYVAQEVVTDFSSPRVVVSGSTARGRTFAAQVDGLSDGRYSVVVRAINAFGEERNVRAVSFTVDSTPPVKIDNLSASISASVA